MLAAFSEEFNRGHADADLELRLRTTSQSAAEVVYILFYEGLHRRASVVSRILWTEGRDAIERKATA